MPLNKNTHFTAVQSSSDKYDMVTAFGYHARLNPFQTWFIIADGKIQISGVIENDEKYKNWHPKDNYSNWFMEPQDKEKQQSFFDQEREKMPPYKVAFFKDEKGVYHYKGIFYYRWDLSSPQKIHLVRIPGSDNTDIELQPYNQNVVDDLVNYIRKVREEKPQLNLPEI